MVDTNSDPQVVDFAIPANDDATKSIEAVLDYVTKAIAEGLSERKLDKDKADKAAEDKKAAESKKEEIVVEESPAAPAPEAAKEEKK